jgi:sterol desaturase/sphingolipid hydroxylase (fatty acid hydroxylase superfamily)
MRHHFQDHRYGFGVSSPLWDAIIGTMPRSRKMAARDGSEDREPTPSA